MGRMRNFQRHQFLLSREDWRSGQFPAAGLSPPGSPSAASCAALRLLGGRPSHAASRENSHSDLTLPRFCNRVFTSVNKPLGSLDESAQTRFCSAQALYIWFSSLGLGREELVFLFLTKRVTVARVSCEVVTREVDLLPSPSLEGAAILWEEGGKGALSPSRIIFPPRHLWQVV